jgi:hypothetical protein
MSKVSKHGSPRSLFWLGASVSPVCVDPPSYRTHCFGSYLVDGSGRRLLSRPLRCIVGRSVGVEMVVGEVVTFADESSGHEMCIRNVQKDQQAS